ncbi:molybdenum cofactor guanylyltransferase [Domibacillus sp. A3M-37]|uniref:molybdenum cofactor guanylyltransferase n=1 Tax=Domibacillus sp. A3M-37 TaxID=2962037 RepID=UPI0020B8A829|nr:molybdenum cofactor guanylyltransferase [Domibacillus sp. A3M-37]MCP3763030.1 molybdenum cofactor guanylyltransferase [Domibacillus sp. A3M-37]
MKTAGIVLAGGQSSRYGRPKMFETYKEKPFYQYSVNALSANGLNPIIISTNPLLADGFDTARVDLVLENEMHNGPLFAIHHVMKQYDEPEWFFVLSADIPFVTETFVYQLLAHRHSDYNAIVPVQENKLQPLLALYHRQCLPMMEQVLNENKRSLMALLKNTAFKTIPFTKKEHSFININTISDLNEYKD